LVAAADAPVQPVSSRILVLEAFNGVCRAMSVPNSLQGSLDFDQNCRKRRARRRFLTPEPASGSGVHEARGRTLERLEMGRGLLLWLIGIPLPIILVVWLLGGLN